MTAVVCPYCRANIGAEDGPMVCEGCGTAHHADCYAENGGCTIFGCSKAPGDEPKVSVSTPELVAAAVPATLVERRLPPPPPTRRCLSTTSNDARPADTWRIELCLRCSEALPVKILRHLLKKRWCTNRGNARATSCWARCWGRSERTTFMRAITKRRGSSWRLLVLTLGFGSPMSWMWAVIDICTIDRDGRGVQFES